MRRSLSRDGRNSMSGRRRHWRGLILDTAPLLLLRLLLLRCSCSGGDSGEVRVDWWAAGTVRTARFAAGKTAGGAG